MKSWTQLVQAAERVANDTLAALPEEIRTLAQQVPLSFEAFPSEEMIEEGIADDTLGLFVGESYDDRGHGSDPLPGQILLFLENLWEFSDHDMEIFREEVRVTLLHELGHFLGWDEQDLFERDLD
jgi:predicted Zn-dependent protease with MMP-like domain